MSYESIPNQPIRFNTLTQAQLNCGCTENEYAQLVDFSDEIFFQLESSPCNEGTFGGSVSLQQWTQEGSNIVSAAANPASFFSQPFYPLDMYPVFKVDLVVTDIVGTLVVGVTNSGTQNITTPGTHTLYFETTYNLTNPSITLTITGATFIGTFYVSEFSGVPNGGLFLGVVDASDPTVIIERIDPTITTRDQYLTAGFDVSTLGLTKGCYRLAIAEYCTNLCGQYYIVNPYFNTTRSGVTGWSSVPVVGSSNWVLDPNEASLSMSSGDESYLQSVTSVCEDVEYVIEIVVDSISNARLRLNVDGTFYGSPITTAGTYSITFTPTSAGNIRLYANQISGTPSSVTVSKVSMRAVYTSVNYDRYSDVIQVGDFDSDCDYFKIEGCNGEDQFNLAFFGTSFLPGIRLRGRQYQPQYDTDVDAFRYASGRWNASFVDRRKKWTFAFGRLPEYVLDFLSIVFYFDKCYINGETYFPSENAFPTIEYNDADQLGSFNIELYKRTDRVRKTTCTDTDANCLPSILNNADEPFILTQDGERIVSQGGSNIYYEN